MMGSPESTDIRARLGVYVSIKSMIYGRTFCSKERGNKLFDPYSEATPYKGFLRLLGAALPTRRRPR
jgi:hypothetical protein